MVPKRWHALAACTALLLVGCSPAEPTLVEVYCRDLGLRFLPTIPTTTVDDGLMFHSSPAGIPRRVIVKYWSNGARTESEEWGACEDW